MRKLIFLLVALLNASIVLSDNSINKSALSIKTNDYFPTSILISEIDSVTFSNVSTDGVHHDSMVVQKVHLGDSTFYFSLDSVLSVSITNQAPYFEVMEHYKSLSLHLEQTNSLKKDSISVHNDIIEWIQNQPDITNAKLIQNGLELDFKQGAKGYIIYTSDDDNDSYLEKSKFFVNPFHNIPKNRTHYNTSNDEKNTYYLNIGINPDEEREILYNTNVYLFKGSDDFRLSLSFEESLYNSIFKRTPLSASLHSNKKIGDLNEFISEIPNTDLAIISHTHGSGDGGFIIPGYSFIYGPIIQPRIDELDPAFMIVFRNRYLEKWSNCWIVHPKFFKYIPTGNGVGVLNYCWSESLRSQLSEYSRSIPHKSFASYAPKAYLYSNTARVQNYLYAMFSGYNHENAIKATNEIDYADEVKFVEPENTTNKRFLAIEEFEEPRLEPENDRIWVKFVIHGWKNIKKDIKKIKIWYKDEPFTIPDESCQSDEYDFAPYPWYGWRILFYPCTEGPEYSYNYPDGPAFFAGAYLNGLESDNLYYTLGFEYDDGEIKNVYYGNVNCVTGIRSGITPGQCIDMGLPSGTKWAAWNIGANKPEAIGGQYGWGEPTGEYFEQPFSAPGQSGITGEEGNPGYTTYPEVVPHYGGENPLSNISGSRWDIANAKWGNGWKLPSKSQIEELLDDNNTIIQSYTLHGVYGVRIISKTNGNKIFIPYSYKDYVTNQRSTYLWTGTLDVNSDNKYKAFNGGFSYFGNSLSSSVFSDNRWILKCVRAVKD